MLDARDKLVNTYAKQAGEFVNSISCLQRRSHMDQTTQYMLSLTSGRGDVKLN